MSHKKDTDYLSISARIRAMENRLLTRERLERMVDAREDAEALKVLAECGYGEPNALNGTALEQMLSMAREKVFAELEAALPDSRLLDLFRLKYDYHNAKVLVKARATGQEASRLLVAGGRYSPEELEQGLARCDEFFRRAVEQAGEVMEQTDDPQMADLLLDKACFEEMGMLAKECGSVYLQGYVRLAVDAANLRTAVRVYRMGKEDEFLRSVLLDGGNVSANTIAAARGEGIADVFQSGALSQAARLGAALIKPGSGALTVFEKACDDAVTNYVAAGRRIPFGEQVVIGYLYAKEAELTAVRTIFAGRAAKLDGDTIRRRLRDTYC